MSGKKAQNLAMGSFGKFITGYEKILGDLFRVKIHEKIGNYTIF